MIADRQVGVVVTYRENCSNQRLLNAVKRSQSNTFNVINACLYTTSEHTEHTQSVLLSWRTESTQKSTNTFTHVSAALSSGVHQSTNIRRVSRDVNIAQNRLCT